MSTPGTTTSATPSPGTTPIATSSGSGRTNDAGNTGGHGGSGRGYGGNRSSGRGYGNRTNDRRTAASSFTAIQQADRDFEGNIPELGVIGLPIENNLRKILLYENFIQAVVLYVLREFTKGATLKPLLEQLMNPLSYVGEKPDDLSEDEQKLPMKIREWDYKYKKYDSEQDQCKENMIKLYGLLFGQCTSALKSEIKSEPEYDERSMKSDALWLLQTIKKACSGVSAKKNEAQVYWNKLRELMNMVQKHNETLDEFFKRVRSQVQTLKMAGGTNVFLPLLKTVGQLSTTEKTTANLAIISATDDAEKKKAEEDLETLKEKKMEEAVLAMLLLQQADRIRYGRRYTELDRNVDVGRDDFPTTVTSAFNILTLEERRVLEQNNRQQGRGGANPSYQFAQSGQEGGGNGNGGGGGGDDRRPREMPPGTVLVPGRNGETINWQCYNCNQWGHLSRQCPEPQRQRGGRNGNQSVSMIHCVNSITMSNVENDFKLKKSMYLIDCAATHSTVTFIGNLTNKRVCSKQDCLYTLNNNTGQMIFSERGDLDFLPLSPHYNTESVANILAFHELNGMEGARIKFDGDKEDAFFLVFDSGRIVKFIRARIGLYFYDREFPEDHEFQLNGASFISTVKENEGLVSKLELIRAQKAREGQEIVAWPSDDEFKTMLRENSIKNTEFGPKDVDTATKIWGAPVPILKGKMKRKHPSKHVRFDYHGLPNELRGKEIQLYTDVMSALKCNHLMIKSGDGIDYVSGKYCKTQQLDVMTQHIQDEILMYEKRGFEVVGVHVDGQFDSDDFKKQVFPAQVHVYSPGEHVGFIENSNKTVKERMRCVVHSLPYDEVPRIFVICLVQHVVGYLNNEKKQGRTLSPNAIVTGGGTVDFSKRKIKFGAYAHVWGGTTNTMKARSMGCIAMHALNEAGGYHFLSLTTGQLVKSNQFEELPVTDDVIAQVANLAKLKISKDSMMAYFNEELKDFEYHEDPMEEVTQEGPAPAEESQVVEPEAEIPQANANHAVVDDVEFEEDLMEFRPHIIENDDPIEDDDDLDQGEVAGDTDPIVISQEPATVAETVNANVQVQEINDHDYDVVDSNMDDTMELDEIVEETIKKRQREETPTETTDNNLRRSKRNVRRGEEYRMSKLYESQAQAQFFGTKYTQKKYGFDTMKSRYVGATQFLTTKIEKEKEAFLYKTGMSKCMDICFVQMHATKGIKQLGERAVAAMIREFAQLVEGAVEGKPAVDAITPESLSEEDKYRALDAVNLIDLKRDGRVKGRSCLNGSKQKQYLKEFESVTSPTVSLEALVAHLLIGAHEEREFISFDVPGAFLQSEMAEDKLVLMKFKGQFVDMMTKVNPEYKDLVRYETTKSGKKIKVLFLKVIRAIYGCIEAAIQWYKLFTEVLQKEGFKINPYDKCIANKMINGSQCSVAWHVDDCMASHKCKKVLHELGQTMIKHFGEMMISTGNDHEFLGMSIHFDRKKKTVVIGMDEAVEKIITTFEEESGEILGTHVKTPSNHYLFNVNMTSLELNNDKSAIFHSSTAKLLYLMKRVRPDLETSVSFLMKRVSKSTDEDWLKLKRVLEFLKKTKTDKRVIGARSLTQIWNFVDASHAVHHNMKSHTGGMMSMGLGLIHGKSAAQKLNTRSTTESELVGVSEYLPYNIWFCNFMGEQGYEITENILYQDNKSAILMEINGRNSCTGNSRHIGIRYFWVKDRVDKGKIKVQYLPTHLMLADFYTKPLMGKLFETLREYIMGWKPIESLIVQFNEDRIKEDVENQGNKCQQKSETVAENDRK